MSGGGRGGFRGRGGFGRGRGRGGGGGGGGGGIGGPFGHDPDNPPDYSTTELFPPQPPPVPNPLSKEERHIVARYRLYREKIHNGPLYTVIGKESGMEDPFNVSKYSARYKPQKRGVPQLDSRPYVKEFFPRELWQTLGIDGDGDAEGGGGKGKGKGKGKKLIFSALDVIGGLDEEDEEDGEGEDGEAGGKGKKGVLRRLLGEDAGDDDDGDDDDEVAEEEEEVEDDFGDDEEGDYNAEMYFNDGDDDGGDDWGDEGGGEDYY